MEPLFGNIKNGSWDKQGVYKKEKSKVRMKAQLQEEKIWALQEKASEDKLITQQNEWKMNFLKRIRMLFFT